MDPAILFSSGFLLLIFILFLLWWYIPRKRSLPCPVWLKWMLDPPLSKGMSSRTRRTLEFLDIAPGMQILDAGCGPGRLTIPLAEAVGPSGTVTAMDLQEGMLAEVRKRADKRKITNISYIMGGIGEGKLKEDLFDRVALITVLGEIPDRKSAIIELFAAMKHDGVLLIEETIRDPHFQSVRSVRDCAEQYGFIERGFFGSRFNFTILFKKP